MYLNQQEIQSLVQYRNAEHPVVSLYLNVTPPRKFDTELNSLIHVAKTKLSERQSYTEEQIKGVEQVLQEIAAHVEKDLRTPSNTRTLAIFADAHGLWREYELPVSLSSQVVVEPDPYTRPLSLILDEFDRYCVLVADSRKARIFSLFLGVMEEHTDIFVEDEVPDRVRVNLSMTGSSTGVRGGLGDERIQRHIEDHVHQHLKHVADKAFEYYKDYGFTKLIVGTSEEKLRPRILDHLHSSLRQRIAGEIEARPEEHKDALEEKALQAAQAFEREQEKQTLDRLLELHNAGDKATLGIEPTLEALMLGQVHTLVVQNDFHASGYVCPRDHFLSTYLKECPLCSGQMEKVSDIAEEMVEEALAQNAEVEHIFLEHEGFRPYGIGALLRFLI